MTWHAPNGSNSGVSFINGKQQCWFYLPLRYCVVNCPQRPNRFSFLNSVTLLILRRDQFLSSILQVVQHLKNVSLILYHRYQNWHENLPRPLHYMLLGPFNGLQNWHMPKLAPKKSAPKWHNPKNADFCDPIQF
jgi:hypothetical protein